jgi:hypothetical protein
MRRCWFLLMMMACGTSSTKEKGSAEDTGTVSWDCDPTAPTVCGLPFPSTFYMRPDPATETGWRIAFGETTYPANIDWVQPPPDLINEQDGWSPLTPLLAHFPGVLDKGFIGHDDIGAYASAEATTVIVDVETGERVPHFVELDATSTDPERTLLLIHTVSPMEHGHRYAVGIRGLKDEDGTIEPSEAFGALRDGTETDDPRIEDRRDTFEDTIFPALKQTGFPREELQLAWDFVIGSQESITGRARWMRDDALERVGEDGPEYVIDEVEEAVSESVNMRIHGRMTVPLYTEEDGPGTLLTRDEDGMPYVNGETTVRFTIIVPQTAIDDPRPLPLLQYGHGLLGSQGEVHASYLGEFANTYGYILFAVDWTGMKEEDVADITLMLVTHIEQFSMIPERSHQGFVEFLCAMRMMTGKMSQDPLLTAVDPDDPSSTISLVDTSRRYYYGNSQGAILGGAYAALSQDFERVVLGVGGMPYHLLLNRSADFDPFFVIFKTMFPDPAHVQFILAVNQTLWDSGEASGYAQAMNRSPLEDTPAKQVLIQVAMGDAQVTTLGAHVMARSYGASLVENPAREVWGLETVASGHTGSALVEFDYGLEVPFNNTPPDDSTDPHENPRRDLAGQQQLHTFLETGEVVHYCDGPCGESE